jgi:hypothetical protein
MKYLLLALLSTSVFAQEPASRVSLSLLLESNLRSITFDSRVGGVRPPQGTPRPTPVLKLSFTIKPVSCLDDNRFSVKIIETEKEIQMALVYDKYSRRLCVKTFRPTHVEVLQGIVIRKTIAAFRYKQKKITFINPVFVKQVLPRP